MYTDRLQGMGRGGKNWEMYELHKSIGPARYDKCSMKSRPSPKEQIVRQGMRPHPGPRSDDQSRGKKERVLGKEVGVDDVYTREPMSSLRAALSTKRSIEDVIQEPRNVKRRTEEDIGYVGSRVVPVPKRCIEARNGTAIMQKAHRSECSNEQCLAAFQVYGLLVDSYGKSQKRVRRFQSDEATKNESKNEASAKETSGDTQVVPMHVDAAVPQEL